MTSKVIVLGGDGFCGWPFALQLASAGHDVLIIDNFSRRKLDEQLSIQSLTPIESPQVRVQVAASMGMSIRVEELDLAVDYEGLCETLKRERPTTIVHLAEQRSAPYSMKSSATSRYTVLNRPGF